MLICYDIERQPTQPASPPRGRRPSRNADEAYRTSKHTLETANEVEESVKKDYMKITALQKRIHSKTDDYYALVSEAMTAEEALPAHERTGLPDLWLGMTDEFGRPREYLRKQIRELWDEQASQQLQSELDAAAGNTAADA